jgi:hypothetical protein
MADSTKPVGASLRKASNERPGVMPTVPGLSRSVSGVPVFIGPRAGRDLPPQMNGALKTALYQGFRGLGEATNTIKTHKNNVRRIAAVCSGFASTTFHCFPR